MWEIERSSESLCKDLLKMNPKVDELWAEKDQMLYKQYQMSIRWMQQDQNEVLVGTIQLSEFDQISSFCEILIILVSHFKKSLAPVNFEYEA